MPGPMPVTIPVGGSTEATAAEEGLLLQIPPDTPLYNKTVAPAQTVAPPYMAVGAGLTVTGKAELQPKLLE